IEFVMCRFCDFRRHQLGHALDIDGDARTARALGDGVRHGFDVAVGRVVEDEDFGHGGSPFSSADDVVALGRPDKHASCGWPLPKSLLKSLLKGSSEKEMPGAGPGM